MPHGPDHGCTKCIINPPRVATAASLYYELTASDSAERLALVAAATHATFEQAIEIGALAKPSVDEWQGCDEASEIMSWVVSYLGGESAHAKQAAERNEKMSGWANLYAGLALDVVSGKPMREHQHAHSHGEGSDLLGK